jgi:hypothetical protein
VTSEPVLFGVGIKRMVHMILILPKGAAYTKKDRLLNNTGAIAFTIKLVVNLVFVVTKTRIGGLFCPPEIEDP